MLTKWHLIAVTITGVLAIGSTSAPILLSDAFESYTADNELGATA